MPIVLSCPKCAHRIVVLQVRPDHPERCGRCGTTVPVGESAGASPAAARAPVAAVPATAPSTRGGNAEWSGVRRGLLFVSRGVRTHLFAGLLAIVGVVLWVYAREFVPRQVPFGQGFLALVFVIPASFVVFVAAILVSAGRLFCLGVPSTSGLRSLAALAAAGAVLSLVDAFVVTLPVLLLPISVVVHLAGEVAFLLFLAGVGEQFGDTALAANAKRFVVVGVLGGAIALGAVVWAASLVFADMAAASRLVADGVEVVRGPMPGGAGPGFVGGLVGGLGLVQWFRWFDEPRLRGVGVLFVPGILFWAGGASGIATAFLGAVASIVATQLVVGYLSLLDDAIRCVPE